MNSNATGIKIVIGLGNPSKEYTSTYHNVGKMFLESISQGQFKHPSKKSFEYSSLEFPRDSASSLTIVKPLTFMNESGLPTHEALNYFKLSPQHLLVAHDDSDMALGTWKLSFDQRSAGHKGIESIINTLGTQKFWRLKIGIRPTSERARKKAEEFVLKKISKKDSKILEDVFAKIAQEML